MGKVRVLLLTLASGYGGMEGGLGMMGIYSVWVAVFVGVEKSRL